MSWVFPANLLKRFLSLAGRQVAPGVALVELSAGHLARPFAPGKLAVFHGSAIAANASPSGAAGCLLLLLLIFKFFDELIE
jgi:hypothetical protein